jgi:type IV pilus assembly protein PilC
MAVFKYSGKAKDGSTKKGETEAITKELAVAQLKRMGISVSSINPKAKDIEFNIPGFKQRVGDKDIVTFTRQFATMIDAGLPLVQCLEILGSQTDNKTFAAAINRVRADVEGGSTFADALRKHPAVFNELYVNLVAAGEAGGILDTILNRLAAYIEKSMALKKKVKGAMVYPSVIMAVAVGVVALMMLFVIPTFAKMFTEFGGQLPGPTLIVLNMSGFMIKWWWALLAIILGPIIAIKQYYKTDAGRNAIDSLLLKTPVIGILIKKVSVAKFTRTLATLISSGIPILEGMEIVAKTSGNRVVEKAILKTRTGISEGKTISEPLKQTNVFPPMVVQMIGVGEASGALDTMLGKIADFYDEEVDSAVGGLTAMLEPLLMVFLGVVLGFIVIAMYLPVFKLAGAIG